MTNMHAAMRATLPRLVLATVIAGALAIAATGCVGTGTGTGTGTSPSAPVTSSAPAASQSPAAQTPAPGSQPPAQPPPAGYQWVGSSSQHFWVAVPKDWIALDLSKFTITAAVRQASLKGLPTAALQADFQNLKARHALFIADPASAVSSPNQFATNANLFCGSTPIPPGTATANALDSTIRAEYVKIGAHLVSLKNTTVNSSEVVITSELTAQATAGFTVTELQVTHLTNNRICELTLSTDQAATFLPTMRKIGRTLQAG
jgi:hypothetical protein